MSATYMHIGIPITNRKPNMTYMKVQSSGLAMLTTMTIRSST